MSARFKPAARTRTRTRSAVGCGASGTSTTCSPSTPPNEMIFTAFIQRILTPRLSSNGGGDYVQLEKPSALFPFPFAAYTVAHVSARSRIDDCRRIHRRRREFDCGWGNAAD